MTLLLYLLGVWDDLNRKDKALEVDESFNVSSSEQVVREDEAQYEDSPDDATSPHQYNRSNSPRETEIRDPSFVPTSFGGSKMGQGRGNGISSGGRGGRFGSAGGRGGRGLNRGM